MWLDNRKRLIDSIRDQGILSFHLLSDYFLCWWYARFNLVHNEIMLKSALLKQEIRERLHKAILNRIFYGFGRFPQQIQGMAARPMAQRLRGRSQRSIRIVDRIDMYRRIYNDTDSNILVWQFPYRRTIHDFCWSAAFFWSANSLSITSVPLLNSFHCKIIMPNVSCGFCAVGKLPT